MAIPKFIPLVCVAAAVVWWFFCEWLRHRSYRRHMHARITPSTSYLGWIGTLGVLAFAVAGLVAAYIIRSGR
jgi:NhaP-type Na+/H+ or K+/H+ antiporter